MTEIPEPAAFEPVFEQDQQFEAERADTAFRIIAGGMRAAAGMGFMTGRAVEKMNQIGRDTRTEIGEIVAGTPGEPTEAGAEAPAPVSFPRELSKKALKAGATLAARTVIYGMADRITAKPDRSRKMRAAAKTLQAIGSVIG